MNIKTPQNNGLTNNHEQILKFLEKHHNERLFLMDFHKTLKAHRLQSFDLYYIRTIKVSHIGVWLEMTKIISFCSSGCCLPCYDLATLESLPINCFYNCLFNIDSQLNELDNVTSNMTICSKEKVTSLLHSSLIWEKNTARKKAFKEEVLKEFNKFRYFPPKLEIRE